MNRLSTLLAMLEKRKDAFLLFALAKEYEGQAQEDKAEGYYRQLLKDFPDYAGTYYHLGKLLERKDAIAEAIVIYQTGIKVLPPGNDLRELKEALAAVNDDDE
jgi:tetratricopeptide (TPR) repeat protein